ncbi:hypothetical protein GPECTOR_1g875 [Gonium pectorale]|uniref:PPM-type phosphatase domain-containing protein n=1 Tax=Gonium pectorale TaxID=33097 RepID=A0A150H4A7_GONPE|nr:hypothetical protein GPECTOR_1g875 [Gonium pectorale]|eukprot:KXZ56969.1 hypothetical protein GPECTOR_1g875 [Gonium pectorale]
MAAALHRVDEELTALGHNSGTTVNALLLLDNHVTVINTGDCRCIVYDWVQERPAFWTSDHNLRCMEERERVRAAGGELSSCGDYVVLPCPTEGAKLLGVTKALGHAGVKALQRSSTALSLSGGSVSPWGSISSPMHEGMSPGAGGAAAGGMCDSSLLAAPHLAPLSVDASCGTGCAAARPPPVRGAEEPHAAGSACADAGTAASLARASLGGASFVLTCEPDVFEWTVQDDRHLILLACDGVFDKMGSSEACTTVLRQLATSNNCLDAARVVTERALKKESNDNITALVLRLGRNPIQRRKSMSVLNLRRCSSNTSSDLAAAGGSSSHGSGSANTGAGSEAIGIGAAGQ